MRNILIATLLLLNSTGIFSQQVLIIREQEFVDTETGTSQGVNVPRTQQTLFQFLNNSLSLQ